MPDPFTLNYTGDQINSFLGQVQNSDTAPAPNATNLVNSGQIHSAIASETTARVAGDDALDTRVTALETVTTKIATYTRTNNSSTSNSITVTGYTRTDPDNITSYSTTYGIITINEAGNYLVWFNGEYLESDGATSDYFTVKYKVGTSVVSEVINETGSDYESFSSMTMAQGSDTISIYLKETQPSTGLNYQNIQIMILKIS